MIDYKYYFLDENKDNFAFNLMNAESQKITIDSVSEGDVVSVYQDANGQVMDIVVSNKTVEGKIEEIDQEVGEVSLNTIFFGRLTPITVKFSEVEKV